MSWHCQAEWPGSRGRKPRGLGNRSRTWHRQQSTSLDCQTQLGSLGLAGQTWDPFRPAKPSALESVGAKTGPAQPSIGATVVTGSATYARQRPNQLVRASVICSKSSDGFKSGQREAHKIASAPAPVSSSTVSTALGGKPARVSPATKQIPLSTVPQEATLINDLSAGVSRPANGLPAFQQLQNRAAPPIATVRSAGGRYLRKRPNQLCRLPSLSPSTASSTSVSRSPAIQKRRMLVVRRRTLTATGTAQQQTAHPQGRIVAGSTQISKKPQNNKSRVYIRDGAAVPPLPVSTAFSRTGAVERHALGLEQRGMLGCKAEEGQVPLSRLAYAHPGGKKLQLRRVPCSLDEKAVNRRPQEGVWVRPRSVLLRKALVTRPRLSSGGGKVLARRPTQLRRIGGQMYRLATNGAGRTLQRQQTPKHKQQQQTFQTPRPVIRKAARYMRQGSTLVRVTSLPSVVRQSVTPRSGTKSSIAARLVARAVLGKRAAMPSAQVRSMLRNVASRRSQYCPAFCRTGVCADQAKGQCRLLHDRTKVAVCPAWLNGSCATSDCPLQHEARPELMPLCTFFLKGACTKENCPYLHKKVDAAAPVCRAFVEGVCLRGVLCPHKHLSARMVKELRASRTLGATSQGQVKQPGDVAAPTKEGSVRMEEAVQAGGEAQQKKRKWRYFWAEDDKED
ncbi:probable zinc finger CCCH domain-containing protein 3 at C-terminar half [Coccomyxa sp. Obi]|nr:probable zinc finger CCCH domain-containing protein 3 at C-terminar half [Coccomyxa sp. Obi]